MKKIIGLVLVVAFFSVGMVGCKDTSPEGVCKHFVEKLEKAEGDEAKDEIKECTEELAEMKKEMGDDKWDKFAGCILEAEDKKAARKCEP